MEKVRRLARPSPPPSSPSRARVQQHIDNRPLDRASSRLRSVDNASSSPRVSHRSRRSSSRSARAASSARTAGSLHLSQICALCETVVAAPQAAVVRVVHRLLRRGRRWACSSMGLSTRSPRRWRRSRRSPPSARSTSCGYYEDIFSTIGLKCAQVLLTLGNLSGPQAVRARARTRSARVCSTWASCPS